MERPLRGCLVFITYMCICICVCVCVSVAQGDDHKLLLSSSFLISSPPLSLFSCLFFPCSLSLLPMSPLLFLFLPLLSRPVREHPPSSYWIGCFMLAALRSHRPSACWVMIIKLKYPGTYQCITSLSTPQTHSYFRGYTGESVI